MITDRVNNPLTFYFDNLWRWKLDVNLPELKLKELNSMPSLESMWRSEWSEEFEKLSKSYYNGKWNKKFIKKCREHLIVGAVRYGLLNANGKPKYDRIESILKRIKLYNGNGNLEYLIDSANLCLLEFEEGDHPKEKSQVGMISYDHYSFVENMECLLSKGYKKLGKLHCLAWAFCECMKEYTTSKHPNKHYEPISDGSPTHVKEK